MTGPIHEDDAIAAIAWLTRQRLDVFVSAALVTPLHTNAGRVYRPVDLARLELLCELTEQFDLTEDALAIVISLIDALHEARLDLQRVARALQAEPAEVRQRIGTQLLHDVGKGHNPRHR
jgi:chaperone modulatory protein CbpM